MTLDNLVIPDQLNREILRRSPDVHAVIRVHHDETIADFASRAFSGSARALARVPSRDGEAADDRASPRSPALA